MDRELGLLERFVLNERVTLRVSGAAVQVQVQVLNRTILSELIEQVLFLKLLVQPSYGKNVPFDRFDGTGGFVSLKSLVLFRHFPNS